MLYRSKVLMMQCYIVQGVKLVIIRGRERFKLFRTRLVFKFNFIVLSSYNNHVTT